MHRLRAPNHAIDIALYDLVSRRVQGGELQTGAIALVVDRPDMDHARIELGMVMLAQVGREIEQDLALERKPDRQVGIEPK
jgi:hypothetical protein